MVEGPVPGRRSGLSHLEAAMADRSDYERRYAGRGHLPTPEPEYEPEVFLNATEGYFYVYASPKEVHHRVSLPGVARVSLDLDDEDNVIGIKLDSFSHKSEVVEAVAKLAGVFFLDS